MTNPTPNTGHTAAPAASQPDTSTNLLDILGYLASNWKWFLISVILFGAIAYLKYATTPNTYFASATVIIKDPSNKTTSAGFDRYDNYINRVNVANEILQFQSNALMSETVRRLNADISYTVNDGLRTRELYTSSPLRVSFIGMPASGSATIDITPQSTDSTLVRTKDADGDIQSEITVATGDTTAIAPGDTIVINRTDFFTSKWVGRRIDVRKRPVAAVAASYLSHFGIRQEKDDGTILKLSLTDGSAQRAKDVLNTLIQVYNEEALADKNRVAVNTADFISERLAIIEKELGGVESDIESFKRDNEIIDISSTAGRYMGESQRYNNEAMALQTQLGIARYIRQYLSDPARGTDLIPTNIGLADVNLEGQISQYNTMRMERDRYAAESSDSNPREIGRAHV